MPKVEKTASCNSSACSAQSDKHTILVVLVLTLGILLRVVKFGELPAGLYHDEAWNGIDAVDTLEQGWRVFYPNNFGREPFCIWLTAFSIKFLGHTPAAIRLPALLMGVLTLPACYLLTRELFGRRIALWALATMAFTIWPIHLSRIGFRAISFPPFMGFAIWQIAKGSKTKRLRHWALGGFLYGITFYTYSVARFTPIAIMGVLLHLLLAQRPHLERGLLRRAAVFIIVCSVTLLPIASYAVTHSESFLQRLGQVSIFRSRASSDSVSVRFAKSVAKTLGMFNLQGDFQVRHNVPYRPVFDAAMGIAFLIGCYESIKQLRHMKYAFVLIWVVVMLGPTILARDAPHFLRAIGIWPIIAILPALGLHRIWQAAARRLGPRFASLVPGAVIFVSLSIAAYDYFAQYAHMSEVKYWFEDAGVQLSHEVNSFLESGWTREEIYVRERPARIDRRVYVDLQLWKDWLNSHFLIPESPAFIVPGAGERPGSPDQTPVPTCLYAWWDPNYLGFWLPEMKWLPQNSEIEMRKGPLATTYVSPDPHPAYVVFTAIPYESSPTSVAQFESGVELVESDVQWLGRELQVRLAWLVRQPISIDYTIFVHVEQNGDVVAQHDDGPMGGCHPMVGCFPMTHWRPGDIVVDQLAFPLSRAWDSQHDKVWVGMYYWQDTKRLKIASDELAVVEGRLQIFPSQGSE
jgi:hypothetical protein